MIQPCLGASRRRTRATVRQWPRADRPPIVREGRKPEAVERRARMAERDGRGPRGSSRWRSDGRGVTLRLALRFARSRPCASHNTYIPDACALDFSIVELKAD